MAEISRNVNEFDRNIPKMAPIPKTQFTGTARASSVFLLLLANFDSTIYGVIVFC